MSGKVTCGVIGVTHSHLPPVDPEGPAAVRYDLLAIACYDVLDVLHQGLDSVDVAVPDGELGLDLPPRVPRYIVDPLGGDLTIRYPDEMLVVAPQQEVEPVHGDHDPYERAREAAVLVAEDVTYGSKSAADIIS